MNTARSILAGVAVVAFSGIIAGPAQAAPATDHCPGHDAPDSGKVELDDAGNSVPTDLADGTIVCVKAGTKITYVEVMDGMITQTEIVNKKGKPLGISYYVPGDEPPCVDDPATELDECQPPI